MIKSFGSSEAEKIFKRQLSKLLPHDIQVRARKKLVMLNASKTLKDLSIPPANRLRKLSGDHNKGQYSIRINDQWRICFVWKDGDAYDVEIVDYH